MILNAFVTGFFAALGVISCLFAVLMFLKILSLSKKKEQVPTLEDWKDYLDDILSEDNFEEAAVVQKIIEDIEEDKKPVIPSNYQYKRVIVFTGDLGFSEVKDTNLDGLLSIIGYEIQWKIINNNESNTTSRNN